MAAERYSFAGFQLNPAQRQLFYHGQLQELNSRYLDALLLLLQHAGELVSKQQFFEQVWPGLVVSDEALTQCIRTLRRVLGDNATAPRFIETVPKHGYRFIAAVSREEGNTPAGIAASLTPTARPVASETHSERQRQHLWFSIGYGVAGAAVAGLIGGMLYGLLAAVQALNSGSQAMSFLLVLLSVTTLLALVAGAAIAAAISAAQLWRSQQPLWTLLAGALAGLLVGAFVSVLLKDMLMLFFGRSPAQLTGATEGLLIGLAVATTVLLLRRQPRFHRLGFALLPGMLAGLLLSLSGGVLLAGSLAQLAAEFPQATLGKILLPEGFARIGLGNGWRHLSAMLEAGLFSAGLALGLQRAQQRLSPVE